MNQKYFYQILQYLTQMMEIGHLNDLILLHLHQVVDQDNDIKINQINLVSKVKLEFVMKLKQKKKKKESLMKLL